MAISDHGKGLQIAMDAALQALDRRNMIDEAVRRTIRIVEYWPAHAGGNYSGPLPHVTLSPGAINMVRAEFSRIASERARG